MSILRLVVAGVALSWMTSPVASFMYVSKSQFVSWCRSDVEWMQEWCRGYVIGVAEYLDYKGMACVGPASTEDLKTIALAAVVSLEAMDQVIPSIETAIASQWDC